MPETPETHRLDTDALALALAPADERAERARALRATAEAMGVWPASIRPVYDALAERRIAPLTVPAMNLRGLTYPVARAAWRAALKLEAAPLLFELAPVEATIGDQPLAEYGAMVLAAAAREGHRGPVFLQADHVEVADDTPASRERARALCSEAWDAGFRQIDIDAAALTKDEGVPEARLAANAAATAELAAFVHTLDPEVVVGGEVGEIGGANTTVEELRTFLDGVRAQLGSGPGRLGKVSVQTGTRHGGVVMADGRIGVMDVDFAAAAELARVATDEYGLPGIVQHGASTLTVDQWARLPAAGVHEVHLAAGIQNVVMDDAAMPAALTARMRAALAQPMARAEHGPDDAEREDLSDEQLWIENRWHAWGVFKADLWTLPEPVLASLGESAQGWFERAFAALGIAGRVEDVARLWPPAR